MFQRELANKKKSFQGIAGIEFALFMVAVTPFILGGIAYFNWLFYLKEISILEHSLVTMMRPVEERFFEVNWEGINLQMDQARLLELSDATIEGFQRIIQQKGLHNNFSLFFSISLWRVDYNPQTGQAINLTGLHQREVNLGQRENFSRSYIQYINELPRILERSFLTRPSRVPLGSIPVHYNFGPTIFGNVEEIAFMPNKYILSYFLGVRPRSAAFRRLQTVLRYFVREVNLDYVSARVLPLS
ncbi:MAG: hypothetical protein NZT61_05265 [Deltaproteobacteria bacterium]|nr:hypothetical protein [Deltaproteobacteria bacterium]